MRNDLTEPSLVPYFPPPLTHTHTTPMFVMMHSQWAPTLPGYLSFLVESKAVYEVMEKAMKDDTHPECECATTVLFLGVSL